MSLRGYQVVLTKEDFKFSVAHFTVFGADRAERLHGHNYRVSVFLAGKSTDSLGLLVNLEDLKQVIRRICADLDGKTLVPTDCSLLQVTRDAGRIDVCFGVRQYRFPEEDALLLPIVNTSIEELAFYIWKELAPSLDTSRVTELIVEVGETKGQSCRYGAALSPS